MTNSVTPDRLPDGLLSELLATYERHGLSVAPVSILEATVQVLRAGDRRASTALIWRKLINAHLRPATEFVMGERYARADDLALITGEAISGIQSRAEKEAAEAG